MVKLLENLVIENLAYYIDNNMIKDNDVLTKNSYNYSENDNKFKIIKKFKVLLLSFLPPSLIVVFKRISVNKLFTFDLNPHNIL